MTDPQWRMPDVAIGTPVEIDPNPRFDNRTFGIVIDVFPRAVAIIMFSQQDVRSFSDCVHVSDPNLERIEDSVRDAPHRAVWDIAPGEKERREVMRIVRDCQEAVMGMRRLQTDVASQVSSLQKKMVELKNAMPKKLGRPPKNRTV